MSTLQDAAAVALVRAVIDAFSADTELAWIVIPCSFYTPQADTLPKANRIKLEEEDSNYASLETIASYHKVQPPFVVTRSNIHLLADALMVTAAMAPPKHEMAFGATWTCGFKNTTVEKKRAQVFDATPGLDFAKMAKRSQLMLPKYDILCTGNSYHFWIKGNVLRDLNVGETGFEFDFIDQKWDNYRSLAGGYIRLTAAVKGKITNLEDEK